jgi:hypothetical protein
MQLDLPAKSERVEESGSENGGQGGGQDKRRRHAPAMEPWSAQGLARHAPNAAACCGSPRHVVNARSTTCRLRSNTQHLDTQHP